MPEVLLANLEDIGVVGGVMPTGGTAGQSIVKTQSADFAATWQAIALSVNGETGVITLDAGDIGFDEEDNLVATDVQGALALVSTHIGNSSNPHNVTATQLGLGNVSNTSNATERAAVATLTNKTIAAGSNTISGLTLALFAANVIDPDVTFAADSDDRLATQKATKALVAAVSAGLQPKTSVVVRATTGTLATDFDNGKTANGVVLATGDRFFWHAGGVAAAANGIYIVAASGAPTRSTDMDVDVEFPGALIPVLGGTVYSNTLWVCTTTGAITVGTTPVGFTLFPIPALTAADILTLVKTVDGAASGLDADLLDAQSGAWYLDLANATGTLAAARIADTSLSIAKTSGLQAALDAKLASASYTAADVLTKLLTVDGAGSLIDADLLDGLSSTAFSLAAHTHAFSALTSKPTTQVGFGITDGLKGPIDYAAVGDGTTDDTTPVTNAANALASLWAPHGKTFYAPSYIPTKQWFGPGSVKLGANTFTNLMPVVDVEQSSMFWNPTDTHGIDWLFTTFPAASGHANVVAAIGCIIPRTPDTNYVRNTVMGAFCATQAEYLERCDIFGQGAGRNMRFGQRLTLLGTLTSPWKGILISTAADRQHDFYDTIAPSSGAWNWDNLESLYLPGVRAAIASLDDTDCAVDSDDILGSVAVGRDAGSAHINGVTLTSMGYKAHANAFICSNTVTFGAYAGRHGVFANDGTFIGTSAGWGWVDADRVILLGNEAGIDDTPVHGGFVLQSQAGTTPLMSGNLDNGEAVIGGGLAEIVSGAALVVVGTAAAPAGAELVRFRQDTGGVLASIHARGSGAFDPNAANAIFKVGTMGTTGRSINVGGTVNVGGADYAEYRQVRQQDIKPGDLVGMDSKGFITTKWADIRGRVFIKSTEPNLVGNDKWGKIETIVAKYGVEAPGEMPKKPSEPYDPSEPSAVPLENPQAKPEHSELPKKVQARVKELKAKAFEFKHAKWEAAKAVYDTELAAWETRKTAFDAAYETERKLWDRIALCGQVPVNIKGLGEAHVGMYLVPEKDGDGIGARAITQVAIKFDDYKSAFAVIEAIGEDGRALVSPKIN